jgi:hypothetical protein
MHVAPTEQPEGSNHSVNKSTAGTLLKRIIAKNFFPAIEGIAKLYM